jgi:predicted RecB family nuclease
LFGYSFRGEDWQERYVADWAFSRAQERAAFERFIDFVMNRLSLYPDLHIYHFAPYEPAALKRLMGRYATREDELDQLLRGKRFVGLFAVARQGLRASVESYSIKRLEPLYGYVRETAR